MAPPFGIWELPGLRAYSAPARPVCQTLLPAAEMFIEIARVEAQLADFNLTLEQEAEIREILNKRKAGTSVGGDSPLGK